MSIDALLEPAIVFTILTAGVLFNHRRDSNISGGSSENLLSQTLEPQYRERKFFGRRVRSRNTARWRNGFVSRVLRRLPFLVEVWYWLLVYWTYQLARAFTAVTLKSSTITTAHAHALSVISLEKYLGLFLEPRIQSYFLERPLLLQITNRIYSFIHIPGTITFLAWLYHYAPVSLFEAQRRTLAVCNLMAFVVFTAWPCMPPRLLPEEDGFGFVDTVHIGKIASVWTTNRFCNQLAAMPSLHFGYAFVIGLTIATMPNTSVLHTSPKRRALMVAVGMGYPLVILIAIIATANHYILDAVAGFVVALAGWYGNGVLENLLVVEDAVFNFLRVHKPSREGGEEKGLLSPGEKDGDEEEWWRRA